MTSLSFTIEVNRCLGSYLSSCDIYFNTIEERDKCLHQLNGLQWKGNTLKAVVRDLSSSVEAKERLYISKFPSTLSRERVAEEIQRLVGDDVPLKNIHMPKESDSKCCVYVVVCF